MYNIRICMCGEWMSVLKDNDPWDKKNWDLLGNHHLPCWGLQCGRAAQCRLPAKRAAKKDEIEKCIIYKTHYSGWWSKPLLYVSSVSKSFNELIDMKGLILGCAKPKRTNKWCGLHSCGCTNDIIFRPNIYVSAADVNSAIYICMR